MNRAKETFLKANVDTQPLERVITVQDSKSARHTYRFTTLLHMVQLETMQTIDTNDKMFVCVCVSNFVFELSSLCP